MSSTVKPIPDGYHTVNPSLTIKGAAEALEFYEKALGAEIIYSLPMPDGKVMHAEMKIGNSTIMLSDEFPDWGALSPATIKGCPITLMIYVEDVDASHAQAIKAGAKENMAPADQFWGDRMSGVNDPYGYKWNFLTHIEDVSPEEIKRRADEWLKNGSGCGS